MVRSLQIKLTYFCEKSLLVGTTTTLENPIPETIKILIIKLYIIYSVKLASLVSCRITVQKPVTDNNPNNKYMVILNT